MSTDKKVALITGSSRGLGKELALFYLKKGYQVYGCSRGSSTIQTAGYEHSQVDLSDENQVRSWVNGIRKKTEKIDLLVCSAGLVQSTLFLSLTPGDLMESFLKTNISGVFYPVREVSKQMTKQRHGRIVAISSSMVPAREKGTSIYSSTKSFITQMIKVLAKEVASQGVTCNLVAPALMATSSSEELSKDPNWKQRVLDLQVFPRVIEASEVCHAVDFFAQDQSAVITGQVLYLGVVD